MKCKSGKNVDVYRCGGRTTAHFFSLEEAGSYPK